MLIAYLFLAAYLTWPLLPRMGSGLSASPDPLLNFWILTWNFHILPGEPLSLFDANIFFPRENTLTYSEHLFGVALFSLPAYLATGNAVFAYNFALIASFFLSGFGMYLLVRELTDCRWAALVAGTIYAAAPYRFLHLLQIQLLTSQWFPFVFLYLYRFLREGRRRQAVAASAFALLQVLSCNYYALYLALALALFGVVVALAARRLLTASKIAWLAGGMAAVALISLPFFLPYERNRREQGFYRRYEDVRHFSAAPVDYLRPSSFNKAFYVNYLPPPVGSEKSLFPGLAALVLAGLSFLRLRRHEPKKGLEENERLMWIFFAALAASAFILSLGPQAEIGGSTYYLPYRLFYRYIPGFAGLRVPARLALLVLLGLAALSGMGLAALLKRSLRWKHWLGAAFLGFVLFEYRTHSLERVLPAAPPIPPVYRWLASQPGDFGILELPIHEDITREATYMYYSTLHWKRLANGFSGWWPNDYWVLVARMAHFPTARILRFLRERAPVRLILIHYDQFPPGQAERLRQAMHRYRDLMPLRARFGQDLVYELLPETTGAASATPSGQSPPPAGDFTARKPGR